MNLVHHIGCRNFESLWNFSKPRAGVPTFPTKFIVIHKLQKLHVALIHGRLCDPPNHSSAYHAQKNIVLTSIPSHEMVENEEWKKTRESVCHCRKPII